MNKDLIRIAQNILLEQAGKSIEIPAKHSSSDTMLFDGNIYSWKKAYAAFCFIGNDPGSVLTYIKNSEAGEDAVHDNIFIQIEKAFDNFASIGKILDEYPIHTNKKLSISNVAYAVTKQKIGSKESMYKARTHTFSGRIWKDRISESLGRKVSVVVFWNKEKEIKDFHLETIKKEFKLLSSDFFWAASDSINFNQFGEDKGLARQNTKNLHSVRHPELSHEEIMAIILKKHTNSSELTKQDLEVLEDIGESKGKGRIYPAGYHNMSRTSESLESDL